MEASDALLDALSEVTGTGSFCSTGHAPFFFPELEVEGLGEMAFPLVDTQVRELIARAEKAPYGQGEKTVRDDAVRKCWQLDAAEFRFGSRQWTKYLKGVVGQVREDLGIEGKVSAHPYKLLVYGKGGHFKAHRDTEKLDAMFGTLIVALPSKHEGGRLRVRHGGRETVVDFSGEAHRREFQHAAFFADCEHEVDPVKSGYRCCVVYNLRLDRGDPGSLNRAVEEQARKLTGPLAGLREERGGELTAVLLDHSYTEANFSLRNLKGHDATRARALLAAADEAGFKAHLGLVTYHQMGELEGGYGGDWDVDEETGEMGEIYDESRRVGRWRSAADRAVPLGEYAIGEAEILAREPLGEGDPDEREAEGFTGNAGCTMEYWYRRAAVVLWPKEDDEAIMCRYNFRGACQKLAALAKPGGKGARFQRLMAAVIRRLPEHLPRAEFFRFRRGFDDEAFRQVMAAVVEAGDPEWLDELIDGLPDHAWRMCDESLWDQLMRTFGGAPFGDLVERLMAAGEEPARAILFRLVAALAKRGDEAVAERVAGRLAGLDPLVEDRAAGLDAEAGAAGAADPAELRALLVAVPMPARVKDRRAVLKFVKADRSLDHVREALGPVLLEKAVRRVAAEPGTVAAEALAFARELLAKEIARPLKPYPDWRRPCPEGDEEGVDAPSAWPHRRMGRDAETSEALGELRKFMADPAAERSEFRYSQPIREVLEGFIRSCQLDLDTTTNRKGRPYGLSCTKNDHSYHRALARRAEDEKLLAKLEGI